MRKDVVLVDVGTGNLFSVYNALRSLGYEILLSKSPHDLLSGERVILPGVGAFGKFMDGLHVNGIDDAIKTYALSGRPLLGICVGMQAFFETSEELGVHSGIGLLKGKVRRFPDKPGLKIPHNGWNQLMLERESLLFKDLVSDSYVFFNHSYYCDPEDKIYSITSTDYGVKFTSSVHYGLVYGVQFHPEKSQTVGLKILDNFMRL